MTGAQLGLMVSHPDVVEQARGFLRGSLDISVDDALVLLHHYASIHGDQLSRVSRRLITEPDTRAGIIADLRQMLDNPS